MGEKKGKNVISREDQGTFILEKRSVKRGTMPAAIEYDLKVPKTAASFIAIYGEVELLRMAIASLKTENDDAVERSGKPEAATKGMAKAMKGASEDTMAKIAALLKADAEARAKATTDPAAEAKQAEIAKAINDRKKGK